MFNFQEKLVPALHVEGNYLFRKAAKDQSYIKEIQMLFETSECKLIPLEVVNQVNKHFHSDYGKPDPLAYPRSNLIIYSISEKIA